MAFYILKEIKQGSFQLNKQIKKKKPAGKTSGLKVQLFANVWQKCNVSCTFYSYGKLSLVTSASTCYSARNNFCSVREESS